MRYFRFLLVIVASLALSWVGSSFAYKSSVLRDLVDIIEIAVLVSVPASGSIKLDFSTKGEAEELVLRVIDSAKSEIKMLAYSFTSSPVMAALLRDSKYGVSGFPGGRLQEQYQH